MYGKEIFFKIDGEETSDKTLLVSIPSRYADMFEGYNFRDAKHLSQALMFVGCANEAFNYRNPWKLADYEDCLRNCLNK